jgi:Tol biopolymer transport system component
MRSHIVLAAAVLMVPACGEDQPEPVAPDVMSLRVTGEQEQVKAYGASLSPDGQILLYHNERGTCVRGVDGSREHCLKERYLGDEAWSPGAAKLALTELYALGIEPDLWVLDVSSGELTNLTDDGITSDGLPAEFPVEPPEGAAMDAYPSWSADGQEIRFVRRESPDRIALMAIPAGGGEPKRLRSIDTNWERLQEVAWAQGTVAWLSGPPEGGGGEVFVAGLAGGEPRKVLDGEYRILSFSSDGEFLLADQDGPDGLAAEGKARVVPTRGGEPIPVAQGTVAYPTWAPTGHAIAYVETPGALRVVGRPGGEPRDLHREGWLGAADLENLDWAPGKLLVKRGTDTPVILTISG